MARPQVTLRGPAELFVGEPYEITIEVTAPTEAYFDSINLRVLGKQGWVTGAGKSRVEVAEQFPELAYELMPAGVLAAGETLRFRQRIALPPGTAPTHELTPARARLVLRVHIVMPWRVDVRHDVELPVRVPPPANLARMPGLASGPLHAGPGFPRLELALASTRIVAGELLSGTVAVFHMDDREPREVRLAVQPVLALHRRSHQRDHDADGFEVRLTLPAGSAGTSVPFTIQVPGWIVPSFTTVTHDLRWHLEAKTGSLFGAKARAVLPLEVIDASAGGFAPLLPPPPQLADAQIARAFRAAAGTDPGDASGEVALLPGGRGLEQVHGDATISVLYTYRGEAEAVLVSRIEYPTLGLGLHVKPGSRLRSALLQDVEIDVAAWDRAHYVDARDAEQAVPFLRTAVTAWGRAQALGNLVHWTDTALVFELPVTAFGPALIRSHLAALEDLATAIAEGAALIEPPPGVTTDLDGWRALAAALEGRLTPGDLSLTGTIGNLPVGLAYQFGEPTHVVEATVGPPPTASAQLAGADVRVARPARSSTVAGLDDDTAQRILPVLQRMPLEVANLSVGGGVARAALYTERDAPLDPARVKSLVEGLRGVLAALDAGPSPYR